jgi:hypothetical protein
MEITINNLVWLTNKNRIPASVISYLAGIAKDVYFENFNHLHISECSSDAELIELYHNQFQFTDEEINKANRILNEAV